MTSDEKRLERHRRYNRSAKGAARYKRYEDKHPERKQKWSELMEAKARFPRGGNNAIRTDN